MTSFARRFFLVFFMVCLVVGCGVSGPPSDGTTEESKNAPEGDKPGAAEVEKKPEVAPEPEESAQEKIEKTWSWQAREMGKVIKEQVTRCQKYATDKISPPAASKMMPSVSLKEFRSHCEILTTHYDRYKERYWGSHYSIDSLLGNLARFKDAYERLLPVWKEDKPSVSLQEGLQGMVNAMRTLSRSAGMVAGMELTARSMTDIADEVITRGKLRAHVTRVAREADGADLEKLLNKLEAYGTGPIKDGTPIHLFSLEHTTEMFRRRLLNRRARWMAMKTDSPGYDDKFKKVALKHLDQCDALVKVFREVALQHASPEPPSSRDSKAGVKRLRKQMDSWKASLKALPEALGAITD